MAYAFGWKLGMSDREAIIAWEAGGGVYVHFNINRPDRATKKDILRACESVLKTK